MPFDTGGARSGPLVWELAPSDQAESSSQPEGVAKKLATAGRRGEESKSVGAIFRSHPPGRAVDGGRASLDVMEQSQFSAASQIAVVDCQWTMTVLGLVSNWKTCTRMKMGLETPETERIMVPKPEPILVPSWEPSDEPTPLESPSKAIPSPSHRLATLAP